MLDLIKDYDEKWFEYSEDEKYKLRFIDYNIIQDLQKEHKPDSEEYNNALVDVMIQDWKGIQQNNKDLECNLEYKKILLERFASRRQWIFAICLNEKMFFDKESELKN